MRSRVSTALAAAFLLLAPAASHAALVSYSQNFESLVMADASAMSGDGWLVYGNVYSPTHTFIYGYGAYPAPNGTDAFCSIVNGQGGLEQGTQQLSVYSDYKNTDHALGRLIEANVFQQQTISLADVGNIWTFQFDAKMGNLVSPSTALAFIKTLDPVHGYATTNLITADMTSLPATWTTHRLSVTIDAGLVGQILQFGFSNTASNYISAGVVYDNLTFQPSPGGAGVGTSPRASALELSAPAPNPSTGATHLRFAIAQRGTADLGVFDLAGRRVATLFHGVTDAGSQFASWDGRASDGRLAPSGVYRCVLQTATGRQSRSIILSR